MNLLELLNVLGSHRGTGSTSLVAKAAVKDRGLNPVFVCASQNHAANVAATYPGVDAVPLDRLSNSLRGRKVPVVFDHYAVFAILNAAVGQIGKLESALDEAKDAAECHLTAIELLAKGQLSRMVKVFHLKFGHPVRTKPAVPSDEELQFRLKLIKEEFFELFRAAYREGPLDNFNAGFQRIRDAEYQLDNLLSEEAEIRCGVDFPEFVDAIADLKYVLEGTNLVCGVDGDAVMEEVQRANMSKEATHVANKDAFHRGGVKPTKPAGWLPPDIVGCLKAQGWEG